MAILAAIQGGAGIVRQGAEAEALVAQCLAGFAAGNTGALYDLGVAFSTGSQGCACDLIEAHKWFNIAALKGSAHAPYMRAEIAEEMTAREIIEAQKQARAWLQMTSLRAA